MYQSLHTPAPGTSYALGWAIDSDEGALNHAGSNARWYAWVWIEPKHDLAFVAVTNSGQTPAKEGTAAAIRALVKRFKATSGERP